MYSWKAFTRKLKLKTTYFISFQRIAFEINI